MARLPTIHTKIVCHAISFPFEVLALIDVMAIYRTVATCHFRREYFTTIVGRRFRAPMLFLSLPVVVKGIHFIERTVAGLA